MTHGCGGQQTESDMHPMHKIERRNNKAVKHDMNRNLQQTPFDIMTLAMV